MAKSPLVSICTPVYNGGEFLEQAIRGILRQTITDFEYVIVDNNSTDNTAEIIESYRQQDLRIKVFRNDATISVIENFLACLKYTNPGSRWIKYALADDYLFPNCIEEMLKVGESDEQIGFVSSYRLFGNRWSNVGLPLEQTVFDGAEILKSQAMRKRYVCTSSPNSVMYRRSAYEKVGGFDKQYLHADSELAYRLLDAYKLGFVHYVLTRTRLHEKRESKRSMRDGVLLKEYLDFGFRRLDKYQSLNLSDEERIELAKYYANSLLEFSASKLALFDYKNIRAMHNSAPPEVKKYIFDELFENNVKYLLPYFKSQAKFVWSIFR